MRNWTRKPQRPQRSRTDNLPFTNCGVNSLAGIDAQRSRYFQICSVMYSRPYPPLPEAFRLSLAPPVVQPFATEILLRG